MRRRSVTNRFFSVFAILAVPVLATLPACSSSDEDVSASEDAVSEVRAGYKWWLGVRGQVRDTKAATLMLERDAREVNDTVNLFIVSSSSSDADPDAVAAADEAQIAKALALYNKFLPVVNDIITFTADLEKALRRGDTTIAGESEANNTIRKIPKNRMVRITKNGAQVDEDWGIDGARSFAAKLRSFLQAQVLVKQSALGAPGRARDLQEQLRVYNEFLLSLDGPDGAKDQIDHIRRIVESWWDFGKDDLDTCTPFASEAAPHFDNPSCKAWPHVGYLRYMANAERPCLEDREPSLPGSGVARLPGEGDDTALALDASEEAYYAQCTNDVTNLKRLAQDQFNWILENKAHLLWQKPGAGLVEGAEFVTAFQRTSPELRLTLLPRSATSIVCDANANKLALPITRSRGLTRSELLTACGLSEKPPAPACSLVATPGAVLTGQSTSLKLDIVGEATSVTLDGQPRAAGDFPLPVTPRGPSQRYVVKVANRGGEGTCSVDVGVNTPPPPPAPTCTLTATANPILQGQSTALVLAGQGNFTSFQINVPGAAPNQNGVVVSPTQTARYNATITGPGGTTVCPAGAGLEVVVKEPEVRYCAGGPLQPSYMAGSLEQAQRCAWNIALQGRDCAASARWGVCAPVAGQNITPGWKASLNPPLLDRGPADPNACQCIPDAQANRVPRAAQWVGAASSVGQWARERHYPTSTPVKPWPWPR